MRIIFAGTPDVAADILRDILNHVSTVVSHGKSDTVNTDALEIVGVITRPPSPFGRKRILKSSPVAEVATEFNIPLLESVDQTEIAAWCSQLHADLGVVVAFGVIFSNTILKSCRLGWVNAHFSLLPKLRGAAPVQHSILAGGEASGITIFKLDSGMDTGDIYRSLPVDFDADTTTASALETLAPIAATEILTLVEEISQGTAVATPQQGEATFANKIPASAAKIDWEQSAEYIDRLIRATNPEPGAWTLLNGNRVKIHRSRFNEQSFTPAGSIHFVDGRLLVAALRNSVELIEVQPAGKNKMVATDWYRGALANLSDIQFDTETGGE